jgi:hypothetical protein
VLKKISIVFSLAVLGVGIWLISRGDQVDRVCKVGSAAAGGNTHFNHCVNLVSTYFLGYALTILGLIFLLGSIIIIRREIRQVKLQSPAVRVGESIPDDSNPFRAVIQSEKKDEGIDHDFQSD